MKIQENILLKDHTTFRIGGKADFFVEVNTIDELKEAILFSKKDKIPFIVIGGGSNILASDSGFRGLVIRNNIKGIEWKTDGDFVSVISNAGESWDYLVDLTVKEGLFGLENLSLIPGSVGASPIQNIGAYGAEVKQTIDWVEAMDTEKMELIVLNSKQCEFGYRDSIFKHEIGKKYIVTRVAFKLKRSGDTFIGYHDLADYFVRRGIARATPKEVRDAVIEIRTNKLPDIRVEGTAGSFFKNPIVTRERFDELKKMFSDISGYASDGAMKISAGWIIDKLLGLKGYFEGDAGVHPKQALVLVNKGNATAKDIKNLAEKIEKMTKEKIGIELEREVREI